MAITQKTVLRISAVICAISGMVILIGVIYPVISYDSTYGKNFSELISPMSENSGSNFINSNSNNTSQISDSKDFSKASNWFVGGAKPSDFNTSKINFFTISIPKLKIQDATVAIGGEDLNKSLIQYPGTALPGRPGNTVIFGHSILPIFYNPKNYISIFSLLPTLKKGDEISIDYDGISYQFVVENMFEVLPTDLQVLDQDPSDSFITLVTCVPPGDPGDPRRLVVRARVVPPVQ
jgi:sortase A